jgi:hypothetical protein
MNRNLSPYQFTNEGDSNFGGVHAYVKGKKREGVVGQLYWNHTGEITSVVTHPDHARQGLATEMHNRAKKIKPELHHSENRTPDGMQWSAKVGD